MDHVRVIYHHGLAWSAQSPDVPGWRAQAPTYEELRTLAEEQIPFVLDRVVTLEHAVRFAAPGSEETPAQADSE